MVASSGTLSLVVYQICAAEHDIYTFFRGDTCFPKMSYAFLIQCLVLCVALCGLMV